MVYILIRGRKVEVNKKKCIVCGRIFYTKNTKMNNTSDRRIRPRRALTCSVECSKEFKYNRKNYE